MVTDDVEVELQTRRHPRFVGQRRRPSPERQSVLAAEGSGTDFGCGCLAVQEQASGALDKRLQAAFAAP